MYLKNPLQRIIHICLLFCLVVTGALLISDEAEATPMRDGKIVRVGWFDSPYNFMDRYGRRTGYAYEYQKKIAAYTGWSYDYVSGSWTELMDMLRRGELDLLADVSFTDARADEMLFSAQAMGVEEYYIYINADRKDIYPNDFTTLSGKRIGINEGSIQERLFSEWALNHGVHATIVPLTGNEHDSARMLAQGTLDAIVSVSAFDPYYENAYPIAVIGSSSFYFAVNKNRPDLRLELDAAMSQIQNLNRYYNRNLNDKYMRNAGTFRFLPAKESEWLKKHGTIRVGYLDDYMPFCGTDKKTGEPTGFLAACLAQISGSMKNAQVDFKAVPYATIEAALEALKKGDIDCVFPLTLGAYDAEDRKLLLTEPFGTSGLVAIVPLQKRASFDPTGNVRVAVNRGNLRYESIVKEEYPNWNIVYFDTIEECIKGIANGDADCLLVSHYRLNKIMEQVGKNNLIPMTTGRVMQLGFAVRRDAVQLYSIMGRMMNTVSDAETHAMIERYSYMEKKVSFIDFVRAHFVQTIVLLVIIIAVISVLFVKSIKARKKAQLMNLELEHARETAEAANSAKTSFLFNMSHDIRTPMNAIMGFRDLLEKEQDDPEKRARYLGKIKDASKVLLSIINNVLEMARIEKGTLVLDEDACNVKQMSDGLYSVFQELMARKNIEYVTKLDITHNYIYCDMTKIREVFINILSNANKYTPAGGKVSILLEELPHEKEGWVYFRTTVADNGIGMAEDFLPHLFDEFSREHTTTSNKIEGTGLGMSIVKRLVEFMHGTIEVKSRLGEGTTFTVLIPHRIAEQGSKTQQGGAAADPELFRGKHILLAEDNEINAEIAISILEEAGFTIDHAEDGDICVDMLIQAEPHTYDLILMDIQMPSMNGYDAARTIRNLSDKEKADIPIIAMTANAFEEDKRNAFDAGMNGHVAKPIDIRILMSELARVLKAGKD